MLKKFEVGKYYKWIGPKDFYDNWNEDMEKWKDGKKRKCFRVNYSSTAFFDIDSDWHYSHCLEHFEEVKDKQLFLFEDD